MAAPQVVISTKKGSDQLTKKPKSNLVMNDALSYTMVRDMGKGVDEKAWPCTISDQASYERIAYIVHNNLKGEAVEYDKGKRRLLFSAFERGYLDVLALDEYKQMMISKPRIYEDETKKKKPRLPRYITTEQTPQQRGGMHRDR
jgi:hypothetical protein